MPTLKCDSTTRVLFKKMKLAEGRKDKDIVRDAILAYSKSKPHRERKKERKDFVKAREREDREKAREKARNPPRQSRSGGGPPREASPSEVETDFPPLEDADYQENVDRGPGGV